MRLYARNPPRAFAARRVRRSRLSQQLLDFLQHHEVLLNRHPRQHRDVLRVRAAVGVVEIALLDLQQLLVSLDLAEDIFELVPRSRTAAVNFGASRPSIFAIQAPRSSYSVCAYRLEAFRRVKSLRSGPLIACSQK